MPWEEWDAEDPYELMGVLLPTTEDTSWAMAETFIEEFLRLGYGAHQILALFRNPYYRGPHSVWRRHGDDSVKELIERVFARWGRAADGMPPRQGPETGFPGQVRAAGNSPEEEGSGAVSVEGQKGEL